MGERALMSSTADKETQRSVSLADIGAALTMAAALALPLYAVGFIVLIAQMYGTNGSSFSTTLYAASLVPNRVVVGQGMRVLWAEWAYILPFLLLTVSTAWHYNRPLRDNDLTLAAIVGRNSKAWTRDRKIGQSYGLGGSSIWWASWEEHISYSVETGG